MTISRNAHEVAEVDEVLSDDLLLARDRMAHHRAKAARSIGRGQNRRRFLPAAIVSSALLLTAGLADRFVQSSLPRTAAAVSAPPSVAPTSANTLALAQVTQTLAADQKAIAALASAQAQLARSAGQDGSGVAIPSIPLPSLPTLPSIPAVALPAAATAAPATHATTGASVVVR
jgi:hypothetical protein